ncbi:MAG TPA: phosphoribosylglycinamide formyltransferase [Candidatus Thalassarchaeaceae archaeon]|jgi:formyltetrahydrofolate-dependent phosphoribosylglycinamide formyltransferase|nr:phosphoribosylglycinamide formyltransferase [Candidatus Thalassarchaeaceae archaeon]|tara:strand:+ start:16268 stop:16903 length:636 start_codon:yes stop_codon:yes gene_type:complete
MSGEFILPRAASKGDPLRLAVLISGGGSGLSSLLKHQSSEGRNHRTVLILSDRIDAGGLEFGRESGIRTLAIQLPSEPDLEKRRLLHEQEIHEALTSYDTELIVLSGYMRILTPWFVGKWKGRIVNIHPSLLPDFPGAHAHRDVLSAGVSTTGCTVHLVDEGVDSGPILAHREVPVMPDDDEASLQERVKRAEHLLYPSIIDLLALGEISI